MKLNLDSSKTVCKEDVLMCIFKDVPDFLPDGSEGGSLFQEEGSWVKGSHQEVVFGRVGHDSRNANLVENTETRTSKEKFEKPESMEDLIKVGINPLPNEPVGKSSEEIQVWASKSEESDFDITVKQKKTKKILKTDESNYVLEIIENLRQGHSKKLGEKYSDPDMLCDECRWLVKAARSMESLSSGEGSVEDIMKNFKFPDMDSKISHESDISISDSTDFKNYTNKDVMNLLNQVQSCLIENSIILTTQKLKKIVKRSEYEDDVGKETPSEEVLNGVMQEEAGRKKGTSKLCLWLGRLVSKYLKFQ